MGIDAKTVQIMIFVFQALQDGWSVMKAGTDYEFSKAIGPDDYVVQPVVHILPRDLVEKYSNVDCFLQETLPSQNQTGIPASRSSRE